MSNDLVLQHYGRLGMKWGKRLYQNPDGSLTALGRIRYGKGGTGNKGHSDNTSSVVKSGKSSSQQTTKKKKVSEMTDEELRAAYNRLKLEKDYKTIYAELNAKPKGTMDKVMKIVGDIGETSVKNIGTQVGVYALGTAVNKVAGQNIVNPKKGQKDK